MSVKQVCPFVSIIVPIYKVEQYLKRCIESLINQTYRNIQIILVDDGSPDHCGQICKEYADKDSRIIVVQKDNGGVVSARQAGLQCASGEYVSFIDPDDYVTETMCEDLQNIAVASNADIISSGMTYQHFDGRISTHRDDIEDGFYNKQQLQTKIYPIMMMHGEKMERGFSPSMCNKWFKRELIQQILPKESCDIVAGEDAVCVYACMLNAQSMFVCDYYHYQYCLYPQSCSRRYNPTWYVSAVALCKWMDKISEENDTIISRSAFAKEKFYQFYRCVGREFSCKEKTRKERIETMTMVTAISEIHATLKEINFDEMNFSREWKKMFNAFRDGNCKKAYYYWRLDILFQTLRAYKEKCFGHYKRKEQF